MTTADSRASLIVPPVWNCYIFVMRQVVFEHGQVRPDAGTKVPRARNTIDFASLDDHARMPARFFGRMIASDAAGLTG